ncbi:MAG: hypothetical protein J6V00_03130 [Bacteroidaceae bacterium]|nr:hypothetical protein [Bacteroidaceae bacterium]
MKYAELSIGNLVYYNGNAIKVESITKREVGYHTQPNENNMHFAKMCEILPIPITEEILLKIGFKKCIDGNKLYRYAIAECIMEIRFLDIGTLIKLENYKSDYVRKVHLPQTPYIHQLQNAYLLVTGKEFELCRERLLIHI